jgi:hypothetical protein
MLLTSASSSESDDSRDTFSAFEAITSNHDLSECTIWTQQLTLELILDIAANRGVFADFSYPNFIEEELVHLLRNVVAGVHDIFDIGLAVEDLEQVKLRHCRGYFREDVLAVLRCHLPEQSAPAIAVQGIVRDNDRRAPRSTIYMTRTIPRLLAPQLRVSR